MLQRQIPDGEGLKLGIARERAAFMLMVELRQARCHLAAAGTGRGDDDERTGGFDVFVAAEALVADDALYVRRIAVDGVVMIDTDAERFQPLAESVRRRLRLIARHDDAADKKADAAERVDQTQNVQIVRDAEIAAHLVLLDVVGVDDDHDLRLILQLQAHARRGNRRTACRRTPDTAYRRIG